MTSTSKLFPTIPGRYGLGITLKLLNILLYVTITMLLMLSGSIMSVFQLLFLVNIMGAGAILIFQPSCILANVRHFRDLSGFMIRGTLQVFGMALFVDAMRRIGSNEAHALNYLAPVLTTILARISCREYPSSKCIAAMGMSLIGAYIILGFTPSVNILGASEAIIASLMWALYDIICKKQGRTAHYLGQVFWTFLFSSILALPIAILLWEPMDKIDFAFTALVTVCSVANVAVLFGAYKAAPISLLMSFSYLRLVFISVATYIILGELPTAGFVLGGSVIIGMNFYIFLEQRRDKVLVETKQENY